MTHRSPTIYNGPFPLLTCELIHPYSIPDFTQSDQHKMIDNGIEVFIQDPSGEEFFEEIRGPPGRGKGNTRYLEVIPGEKFAIKFILRPSFKFGRYKNIHVVCGINMSTVDYNTDNIITKPTEFKFGKYPLHWVASCGRFRLDYDDADTSCDFAFGRELPYKLETLILSRYHTKNSYRCKPLQHWQTS